VITAVSKGLVLNYTDKLLLLTPQRPLWKRSSQGGVHTSSSMCCHSIINGAAIKSSYREGLPGPSPSVPAQSGRMLKQRLIRLAAPPLSANRIPLSYSTAPAGGGLLWRAFAASDSQLLNRRGLPGTVVSSIRSESTRFHRGVSHPPCDLTRPCFTCPCALEALRKEGEIDAPPELNCPRAPAWKQAKNAAFGRSVSGAFP